MPRGSESTDLVVHMPRATATTLVRFVELLDLADEFCREERLLSLARSPEQRKFQAWFLTEFVRQANGELAAVVARGQDQRPRQRRHLAPAR